MIERFKDWLRALFGVPEIVSALEAQSAELGEIRKVLAQAMLERYVPPQTPEPERKVIKTQTFKQFSDILEQEMEAKYADG